MDATIYDDNFYVKRHQVTYTAAKVILPYVFSLLPNIKSVTDVGCGVGTWLYTAQQLGVTDICGIEGDWVPEQYLKISPQYFIRKNLEEGLLPVHRSDLAISLEVAEHLDDKLADEFVNYLTSTADFVLFSAAIPNQGGHNHVNEQWPDYWVERFKQFGYTVLDVIRRHIWNVPDVPYWYKQNIFLVVKQNRLSEINFKSVEDIFAPIAIVHPELYENKCHVKK